MLLVGILASVQFRHTSLANFLKNLVMANGRADHTTPSRVQCSWLQYYAGKELMAMGIAQRTYAL